MLLKWYCDECGAWYTSDEIKTSDCEEFATTGTCDEKNFTTKVSDAGGLCDDWQGHDQGQKSKNVKATERKTLGFEMGGFISQLHSFMDTGDPEEWYTE
ncbi:hypothetical protein F5Y10DRAFT_268226 [Nemania abortiva]|nr:hypothetical protein F5Y10DRAFT_268226 [Nemania abortiva]